MDRINAYPDKGERRKVRSHASRFKNKSQKGLSRTGNFANHELSKDSDFFRLPLSLSKNVIYREDSFGGRCVQWYLIFCNGVVWKRNYQNEDDADGLKLKIDNDKEIMEMLWKIA